MCDISVIMCLYNTPTDLFKKSIDSLVNQTFKNFECIVYNDGSDKYLEENLKIIEELNDNRIKVYHKEHSGKSNTLNLALSKSQGKYMAIWDSDDIFIKQRLEFQYNWLENHKEYDVLSCALIDKNNYVWPGESESKDIDKSTIHYLGHHATQMFNKENVFNKVPFLFEQCYDGMEDMIFNYIMFYHGCKMRYENKIIGEYSITNIEAAHKLNLYGYNKYCSFNTQYKVFNHIEENPNLTCLLLIDNNWQDELEKTLLNLRETSESISIIVVNYDYNNTANYKEILHMCELYNAKYYIEESYISALNNYIDKITTEYVFIISNPIRICNENWDYDLMKYIKYNNYISNFIIQPYLFDMEKIDDNYYLNSRGLYEHHNKRYGERMILLSKELTEYIDYIIKTTDYVKFNNIPIINRDLCFICKKNIIKDLIKGFDGPDLLNVVMSIKHFLNNNEKSIIYYELQCSVNNVYKQNDNIYWDNYIRIITKIFNETLIVYSKIIKDNIDKKIYEKLIQNIKTDEEYKSIEFNKNKLCVFLKNINHKEPWNL